ncbi:MAG: hypothetical protein Q4Q04_05360 [Methanocorpusculum sp.]|nr:hypothetical protein [Methanocorpusculum sp.]
MKLTKGDKIICGIIAALLAGLVIFFLIATQLSLPKTALFVCNSCIVGIVVITPFIILGTILSWITEYGKKKPEDG